MARGRTDTGCQRISLLDTEFRELRALPLPPLLGGLFSPLRDRMMQRTSRRPNEVQYQLQRSIFRRVAQLERFDGAQFTLVLAEGSRSENRAFGLDIDQPRVAVEEVQIVGRDLS